MTKLEELQEKLKTYEAKLAEELKGYRGVIHENSASEIKHAKVMVYQGMVNQLKEEIEKLKAKTTS